MHEDIHVAGIEYNTQLDIFIYIFNYIIFKVHIYIFFHAEMHVIRRSLGFHGL